MTPAFRFTPFSARILVPNMKRSIPVKAGGTCNSSILDFFDFPHVNPQKVRCCPSGRSRGNLKESASHHFLQNLKLCFTCLSRVTWLTVYRSM